MARYAVFSHLATSIVIRGLQLVFAIISLGLAAAGLEKSSPSPNAFSLTTATAVISIVYLATTMIPVWLAVVPLLVTVIADSVLFVLWLASFGRTTDIFGNASCSFHSVFYNIDYDNVWCKLGKALIAFTLLEWLLFLASLILIIVFSVVPAGSGVVSASGPTLTGAIFSTAAAAHAGAVSDEHVVAPEDSGDIQPAHTDVAEKEVSLRNSEAEKDAALAAHQSVIGGQHPVAEVHEPAARVYEPVAPVSQPASGSNEPVTATEAFLPPSKEVRGPDPALR